MEYITLKHSELSVSRLCMGGCPMGGYGWGAVQENELIDAVHTALDQGITFFDTADTYGLARGANLASPSHTHLPASHLDGDTDVRGAVAATCHTNGYTGDTYCLGCGAKIATGSQ